MTLSGAIQKEAYLNLIAEGGFTDIRLQKEKVILLPDDFLIKYLDEQGLEQFKQSKTGIFSITVFARKPENCCAPNTSCC